MPCLSRLAALMMALLFAPSSFFVSAHAAEGDYPSRPITLIVPFPPGGGTDVVARMIATKLHPLLGQPVVVENKGGAATTLGAGAAARAPADGYTLLLSGSSTYTIVPALRAGLPYDPLASFERIGVVAKAPLAMMVGAQVPARTMAEFAALARAKADGELFATFGNGSGPHFAGAMFADAAKAKLVPVPYKGGAAAMTGLIGGEVALGFDTLVAAAPQVRAGRVRALAVSSDKRSPLMPDVPTYAEAGFAPAALVSWYGLVAPARTPAAVLRRLEKELAVVMADPEVRQSFTAAGLEPVLIDAKGFEQLVRGEIAQFRDIARRANIVLD